MSWDKGEEQGGWKSREEEWAVQNMIMDTEILAQESKLILYFLKKYSDGLKMLLSKWLSIFSPCETERNTQ